MLEFPENARENIQSLVNASLRVLPTNPTYQLQFKTFLHMLLTNLKKSAGSISYQDELMNQQNQNENAQQMPMELNQDHNANHDEISSRSSISSGPIVHTVPRDSWNHILNAFSVDLSGHIRSLIEISFQVAPSNVFYLASFKTSLAVMLWSVYLDKTLHEDYFRNWMSNNYDSVLSANVHAGALQMEMSSVETSSSGTPMEASSTDAPMETSSATTPIL